MYQNSNAPLQASFDILHFVFIFLHTKYNKAYNGRTLGYSYGYRKSTLLPRIQVHALLYVAEAKVAIFRRQDNLRKIDSLRI